MNIKISSHWNKFLDAFPADRKDIYFTEEYTRLYEDKKSTAVSIICEDNTNILLMPFLKREIGEFFDFETPYGYGGPISNTEDVSWFSKALEEMNQYLFKQGYVCGFIRFHPLLGNAAECKDHIEVCYDRATIAIDLNPPEKEIWEKQITSKNRNMIRKAVKHGLEYKAEYDFASINEFIKLYNDTMGVLGADSFYYFSKEYYEKYIKGLGKHAFLATVRKDMKLISAALFMYSDSYGHYHLAGSDKDYSGFGANNFMLWNTARELKRLGIKILHLGGGTTSNQDDSLLKFKKAFSSNAKEFFIGKKIFNPSVYSKFIREWEERNSYREEFHEKRLLRYRYEKE